jgi:hypothetical protein
METLDLLKLQGEIRMTLMQKFQLSEKLSFDVSNEIMHIFLTNKVAGEKYRDLYAVIVSQSNTESPDGKNPH